MKCIFVILGATGDLARRKLFPALYKLLADKKLGNSLIVGAAYDEATPADLWNNAKQFIPNPDQVFLDLLLERTQYQKLDFNNEADFVSLAHFVASLEKKQNIKNRLVYLAAPPNFFCTITQQCAASGLVKKTKPGAQPWHRIVYEKPFGKDRASAHTINECIQNHFDESQIYRIDHYLSKEVVSNIAMIRFANCVFEPLWNNRFVDSVQIVLSEALCVKGRGSYYDAYGALRDVVQNHALELLSLVAMETPDNLVGDAVRDKRVAVLKKVVVKDGLLGQYDSYKQENGVAPDSSTETFASLVLGVDNERWAGVPFYVRAGKCLDKKETSIFIKFKKVDCLLTKGCPMESNYLKIQIDPVSTFALSLNAKKPGTADELLPVSMEFCHSCEFETVTPAAYEVIFEQVLLGDVSTSVRFDEIEAAWKVIDRAYSRNFPLHEYSRGSAGPDELKRFSEKHGIRWLS